MAKIGFIGLGHMGWPMAVNLVGAGHVVTGFDLQSKALEAFSAAGGRAATTLQDAANQQDVVITMLQTGQQVKDVCFGNEGLFAHAAKSTLFIDCSSTDVQSSREFHQEAKKLHFLAADAPVSGGVVGATQAKLTFMVGGSEEAFIKAKEYLSILGKTIVHTGIEGSGQAAKICNNMILGVSMIAVSEAFTLAEHLGLSAEKLFEVVTHSSGQCWAISSYAPVPGLVENAPANNNYKPGFTVAMMLKDLCLSQKAAASVGVKTPMGERATAIYQQFNDAEMGGLDFSAIIKAIAKHH